jgi:signal transduction histidine kinase
MQNGSKNEKLAVLIVEDDEDDFVLTKSLLDEIGNERFDVEWSSSYDEALEKMSGSACHYDVCLLDYRLGAQTGLELLKDARQRGTKCPSILLTGQGDHEIDVEATLTGAADYLVKGELNALQLERSIRYAVQQRQIEEERIQHLLEQEERSKAEAANRAKDEFLATLSHELRTPLNVMLGWVQLLKKNGKNEEIYERAIDAIERSARAQTQLVDDLLDITRIASDGFELKLGSVDMKALVESGVDGMRPVAEDKDISLNLHSTESQVFVTGDADRLPQVLNNLLSNAIKFTPLRGSVTVDLIDTPNEAVLKVTDTGRGIDAGFLPHIFDRYSQETGTKANRKGGLGLGLAIAHRIVEMHGGTITAESEGEGKGATFTVRLPKLTDPG